MERSACDTRHPQETPVAVAGLLTGLSRFGFLSPKTQRYLLRMRDNSTEMAVVLCRGELTCSQLHILR